MSRVRVYEKLQSLDDFLAETKKMNIVPKVDFLISKK